MPADAGPGQGMPAPDRHGQRARRRGHLAMLIYAGLVSGSFSLGALAAPHLEPASLNLLRFLLATALMGGLAAASGTLRRQHGAGAWRYLLLGGLMAVFFVLMFEALLRTDPVSTGTVFTLIPAMAALFGWMVLRQRTTPRMAAALAVGAAGAVWVIFRGDWAGMLAFRVGTGEAIFVIGCAALALYAPLIPRLNRGEPPLVFTFGVLAGATLWLGVTGAAGLTRVDLAALPGVVWLAILYLAVLATSVSFFLQQFAALRLPAGTVMAYTYLVPSLVVLWEGLLGHGWAAARILSGVALTALALLAQPAAPAPLPSAGSNR
ncbi:MAG: DMT family transporter [Pseudomonadota bacterium]